jgi:hypothetical protein
LSRLVFLHARNSAPPAAIVLDLRQTSLCAKAYGALVDADSFNGMVLAVIAALVFGVMLYSIFAASIRMLQDDGRLRLRRMLARRGVSLAAADGGIYEIARATRRCVGCADKAQCDAWLAARRREGFEAFCPNAAFIARCTVR